MKSLTSEISINKNTNLNYERSFACRYNTKKDKLFIHLIKTPEDILEKLLGDFREMLDTHVNDYDPEQQDSDNTYKFNSDFLIQQEEIKKTFLENTNIKDSEEFKIENSDKLPLNNKIDFIIHKFNLGSEKLLIFSKHKGNNVLKRIYKFFSSEDFNKINEDELYVFNETVSCFYYSNHYY
ncbi:hypothetical protein, partial [Salimicrobium jeotgali]|uniref:hypothetical protein n=1 Tax=Salimicrobium jeotgali TaxID=1230341 RepID=UPI0015E116AC